MAMDYEEVLVKYKFQFGKFQVLLFVLVITACAFTTGVNMGIVFFTYTPDHTCSVPELSSLSREDRLSIAIPKTEDDSYEQCIMYDRNYTAELLRRYSNETSTNATSSSATKKCTSWEYDRSVYGDSLVTKFDLVCDKKALKSTAASMYMSGLMVGVFVSGFLSDRFGRKKTLIGTTTMLIISSMISPFSPNMIFFFIVRFFTGCSQVAIYTVSFVLMVELVGPTYRSHVGTAFWQGWAFFYMALALFGYLMQNWFDLHLFISVLQLFWIIPTVLLPESPRWLYFHGHKKEGDEVVRKLARWADVQLPDNLDIACGAPEENKQTTDKDEKNVFLAVIHMFTFTQMRKRTLIIFYKWFAVNLTYYGLSLGTGKLAGNFYINFFLSGAVEVPAYLFAQFGVVKFGRRIPSCICYLVGGIALVATIPIPDRGEWIVLNTVCAMVGKFGITAVFGIIFPYSSEIFPTCVRNSALATASFIGRSAGIIAPFALGINKDAVAGVFGALTIAAGLLTLLLPETKDRPLPDTLEQGEAFKLTVSKKEKDDQKLLATKLSATNNANETDDAGKGLNEIEDDNHHLTTNA